jgi:hypothetical protein
LSDIFFIIEPLQAAASNLAMRHFQDRKYHTNTAKKYGNRLLANSKK